MDGADILRAEAVRLFRAGLAAADPGAGVAAALRAEPPGKVARLVAVGKAARRMAEAALGVLGPVPGALVVTNAENAAPLAGARVLVAGHPVPDANGARAAEAVIAAVAGLAATDTVLVLVSGGGSALLPAPVAGVSLADKAAVASLLLASGADITEMNLVRQQLSRLKGGGLLRLAAPARVRALVLSDVIGDDLRAIASGPTAAPLGTRADARAALRARGLWERLPEAVRAHLAQDVAPEALPEARNTLIGSNAISVAAMAAASPAARPIEAPLTGDVGDAAARVAALGTGTWVMGGETTVTLRGRGMGGRNQELALRVALLGERWPGPWSFLAGGTDGRDGPTDAAGGLVDGGTAARIRAAGLDAEARLADNDSSRALAAAGDLLVTGGTGTNVADLAVLIRG